MTGLYRFHLLFGSFYFTAEKVKFIFSRPLVINSSYGKSIYLPRSAFIVHHDICKTSKLTTIYSEKVIMINVCLTKFTHNSQSFLVIRSSSSNKNGNISINELLLIFTQSPYNSLNNIFKYSPLCYSINALISSINNNKY